MSDKVKRKPGIRHSLIEDIMAEKPETLSKRVRDYFLTYLRMIQDPDNQHHPKSKP